MSYNPTREEIVAELEQLDRSRGSGNAPFVDYKRLARAHIALLDECENLRSDLQETCAREGLLTLQLAEARPDKKRMDWLDGDNWWDFCRSANPKEPTKTFHIDIEEGEKCKSLSAASAREVIDAAISENEPYGSK